MPQPDEQREEMLAAVLANDMTRQMQLLGRGVPPTPPAPPLNVGSGGGNWPDMEPRIASLEAHMEHVRADLERLGSVPATLADMKARTETLPTKEWAFKTLAAMLASLAVIVGLIVRFLPHAT